MLSYETNKFYTLNPCLYVHSLILVWPLRVDMLIKVLHLKRHTNVGKKILHFKSHAAVDMPIKFVHLKNHADDDMPINKQV